MTPSRPARCRTPPPETAEDDGDLVMRLLALGAVLFLFVIALELMGEGSRASKSSFDLARAADGATKTPLLALITGILVMSLVEARRRRRAAL